jgi:uncharacterized protein (TIGR03435 family)
MKPIVLLTAIGIYTMTCLAQQDAKRPAFEIASIKLSKTTEGTDSDTSLGYLRASGSLKGFIRVAYGITNEQTEGGPKWLDEDRYDIEARAEGPARGPELLEMLQTLLADRFKLEFHHTTKTVSGYAIVPAKGGLKIKDIGPSDSHSTHTTRGSTAVEGVSLQRFAAVLSRVLGAPVADETAQSGSFTFTLTWAPENNLAPVSTPNAGANDGSSIFTAVQEQLGLKLDARKVPLDVFVIDRAEKPAVD